MITDRMIGEADIPLIAGSGAGLLLVIFLILAIIVTQRRKWKEEGQDPLVDDEHDFQYV